MGSKPSKSKGERKLTRQQLTMMQKQEERLSKEDVKLQEQEYRREGRMARRRMGRESLLAGAGRSGPVRDPFEPDPSPVEMRAERKEERVLKKQRKTKKAEDRVMG